MSYIDTIDHELAGIFAGLPVYHPLEILEGDPDHAADFACGPDQLVIGGGGGEHPGCVLVRPDAAVAKFIDAWLDSRTDDDGKFPEGDPLGEISAGWEKFIDPLRLNTGQIILFAGWGVEAYRDFYERCTSRALWSPFVPGDERLEEWLIANLGEFVFFSMPELVPGLDENLPGARYHIRMPLYMNVLIPPRNIEPPFGRKMVDGKVVWGNVRR